MEGKSSTDNPKIPKYPLSMLHSTLKTTYLLLTGGYWSLNNKTDVFPVEESSLWSVVQGGT
jgi:hypothetical protein